MNKIPVLSDQILATTNNLKGKTTNAFLHINSKFLIAEVFSAAFFIRAFPLFYSHDNKFCFSRMQ